MQGGGLQDGRVDPRSLTSKVPTIQRAGARKCVLRWDRASKRTGLTERPTFPIASCLLPFRSHLHHSQQAMFHSVMQLLQGHEAQRWPCQQLCVSVSSLADRVFKAVSCRSGMLKTILS